MSARLADLWLLLATQLSGEVKTYAIGVAAYEADVDQVFDRLQYDPESRS